MLGAPPVNWPRLALVAVLLVSAILVQKTQADFMGWEFDLGLAVLMSSAVFLNQLDLVFLEFIAVLLLMWKPYPSLELVLLALLPWGAYWGKKIISLDPWTQNLVFVASGVFFFYFLRSPALFFGNLALMLNDIAGCAVFGSVVYFLFQNLYAYSLD